MKKLDLHIHTMQTISDRAFDFSLQQLISYVENAQVDGIAITNHNCFELDQYNTIASALSGKCVVFPGIEINVGQNAGHLICITEPSEAPDFAERCKKVENQIQDVHDSITVKQLTEVFPEMDHYLWIPHYEKKPTLDRNILHQLEPYIVCGEVNSIKKFVYCTRDDSSLTPVYFSDYRPERGSTYPVRQTFFDISEITVNTLKYCLRDKSKVTLTEADGNRLFEVIPGLHMSTGLNVIIGERSSGKSHTLDAIAEHYSNVKYIHQFELLETDPEKSAREFTEKIAAKKSSIAEQYFKAFAAVVNTVKDISLQSDEQEIENYITSLIKYAKEADRADMFSKCKLYSETEYPETSLSGLEDLIHAVEKLLDAKEYKEIIEAHIQRTALTDLLLELIAQYRREKEASLKKQWVNGVIADIKRHLQSKTAATRVSEADFYEAQLDKVKVAKFNELASFIKTEQIIKSVDFGGFTVQIKKKPFLSAQELRSFSGKRNVRFSDFFSCYNANPYEFLQHLRDMPDVADVEYYKYFANVEYSILNQYGFAVSGGERAEFNLLQQIVDAQQFDMLLIDEPESSFDNIFLKSKVNEMIKELSRSMPVVIVTHNSTVGESIRPDFIIHTVRQIAAGEVTYQQYCGLPSDKFLIAGNGEKVKNFDAILNCLEAGETAYMERRHDYEMLKN